MVENKDRAAAYLWMSRLSSGQINKLTLIINEAEARGVQQGLDMAKSAVEALRSGADGDRNEPVHAAFLSTCILAVAAISKLGGDDASNAK